ncbi:mannitol dehydrogenase family protein [Novosphingobium sp. MD-1]|uniref:mannitol dehydrogenase family protein n=1 Tax=Novosphingobium sp. MD-1 TaxID=1630648 RepID=UPI00061CB230|nr:mannitol dehydrogenase family protein [Novosphingobium sp. MD-1]GAO53418.1 D-mannonate oxidoreductase [Novosphingobium sp. MD-1]
MRLSTTAASRLSADVVRPGYDRAAQAVGIVHFGIGAFHRAHQAWYTDRAMGQGDRDWMITGVSLRSADVATQMNPQDGLYTLSERSAAGIGVRLVGSVRRVLVASEQPEAVIAELAAPSTRIASFTVTEKGYCRAADGSLDFNLAHSQSLYYFVTQGLRRRRDAGLPGLTLLSCDNLADNGRQLEALMQAYIARHEPDMAAWFADNCTCPATMIDRIVPATTDADRKAVAGVSGLDDAAAVVTEPFSQWVIEDRFAGARPRWHVVGAELVADVAPYETAKLRMLNGAHSALAYRGLMAGYSYVHEAIGDPDLRAMVTRLMLEEAAPTIAAAPGQDLSAYAAALIERFANPALNHRLIQIAMDGSQKIPQRWLETLTANQREGRSCPAILSAINAWMNHVRGDNVAAWGPVDDPMADRLRAVWQAGDRSAVARALFGAGGLFAQTWTATDNDLAALS